MLRFEVLQQERLEALVVLVLVVALAKEVMCLLGFRVIEARCHRLVLQSDHYFDLK